MNYLSLDVGTTCCKCQLFSDNGSILEYFSEEYAFKVENGENYVDVVGVWSKVKKMIAEVAKKHEINSLCVSSMGESFVLLDRNDEILFYPMLYTDPRGEEEANGVAETFGAEKTFLLTGVLPHSMYSVYKLLWIKNHHPNVYARAEKLMLVGDYIGYLLSGERVIDYALASRTGAFDIEKLRFSEELLGALDLPVSLFSVPKRAGSVVGKLRPELIDELKIEGNPVLVLGSHDQVCASLGAGALRAGDTVDGMGTVECITALFEKKPADIEMGLRGYACVPYAADGLYCTYMFNYSCGSAINWCKKKLMHDYKGEGENEEKNFFAYIEKGMTDSPTGILFLPYLNGAGTPYQNVNAKGVMVNFTAQTSDSDFYKALLEGAAMEMRLNAEVAGRYAITMQRVVATGGCANSDKWLQIKADIQNIPVRTLRSSEGGLCGCALLQAVATGGAKNLQEAANGFVCYKKEFVPNEQMHKAYEAQYKKYKILYKTVKEMY